MNLIIIDPPYVLKNETIESVRKRMAKFKNRQNKAMEAIMSKATLNTGYDIAFMHEEFKRVQPFLNLYIFCNIALLRELAAFYKDYNYDILVWHKMNVMPLFKYGFKHDLEYIFYLCEDRSYAFDNFSNSKLYQCIINTYKESTHPTEKPLQLLKNCILKSSKKGDVVLDCFSGSGTTAKASIELDRSFLGCEMDKEYYEMSLKRLKSGIEKPLFEQFA